MAILYLVWETQEIVHLILRGIKMNKNLQLIQTMLGTHMTQSPSNVSKFLHGTLLAAEEGTLTIEYLVREEMLNPAKVLHGGIITTMMDDAIGATVYTLGHDVFFTTVNFAVDFFASVRLGEKVTAITKIIKQGANVINAQCELYKAEKLVARGYTNLLKTNINIEPAKE